MKTNLKKNKIVNENDSIYETEIKFNLIYEMQSRNNKINRYV